MIFKGFLAKTINFYAKKDWNLRLKYSFSFVVFSRTFSAETSLKSNR